MRVNIKKIIREEIGEWDWARDTYDPFHPGLIYQTPNGNTLKIVRTTTNKVYYELWDVDMNMLHKNLNAYKDEILRHISDGIWVRVDKMVNEPLKESTENDFDWIESEKNPWSDIPEETINQLTEKEKKLILYIMDSETYWNKREGCEPKYKIDDIEFDEYDDWYGGVNHGIKRKIKLCFTTTCENQTYNNKTYLCATIDRDTLDYHVA